MGQLEAMPALSDHFDGKRFFDPGARHERSFGGFRRWRRTRQPALWPARTAPARPASA